MPNITPIPTVDAARQIGVDVRTIHRWIGSGRITPTMKAPGLRGAYFFDPAEIERVRRERQAEQEQAS